MQFPWRSVLRTVPQILFDLFLLFYHRSCHCPSFLLWNIRLVMGYCFYWNKCDNCIRYFPKIERRLRGWMSWLWLIEFQLFHLSSFIPLETHKLYSQTIFSTLTWLWLCAPGRHLYFLMIWISYYSLYAYRAAEIILQGPT